jgi:hypothetical protein
MTNVTGLPTAGLVDGAVTLVKMANLAQDLFIGRTTASTGVPETATITAAARTVLDDTTVGAMVDTLGGAAATGTGGLVRATSPTFVTPALGTPASGVMTNVTGVPAAAILAGSFGAGAYVISTSLQAATIELGHATDTTLSRVSAGVVAIEGVNIVDVSSAQTLTTKTLTSPIVGTQITLDQTTADYTLTWANPAAARAISIPDPLGTDVFVFRDMTQTLLNKTLTTPTIVATGFANMNHTHAGATTGGQVGAGDLSGTTLAAGVTASSLTSFGTIASPTISGTVAGTLTFSGAITLSATTGNTLVVDTNTLVVDATNNRVGVNTTAPATAHHIIGVLRVQRSVATQYVELDMQGGDLIFRATDTVNASFPHITFESVNNVPTTRTPFVIIAGLNVGIGTVSVGAGATSNLVLGGGTTSPVIGAATADMVHLAGVDFAAGDRRLQIQTELGSVIDLGNNTVRATWATQATADATVDLGSVSGTTYSLVRITSSLKYKEVLGPLTINSKAIYGLKLVDWESRADDWGRRGYSPVAEYAYAAHPSFAQVNQEGSPIGINWPHLNTAILSEVQSHEERLEYLEAETTALHEEVRALRGG